MNLKPHVVGPTLVSLRSAVLVVVGLLAAVWSGRRLVSAKTTSRADSPVKHSRTIEAILDNAATICHIGAWRVGLPEMEIT